MTPALSLSGRTQAEFLGFRGRERSSIFCKRGRHLEYIRPGMMVRRRHPDRSIETARVLSVAADSFGIPHIRYEVRFDRPYRTGRYFDGPRMLALITFIETYGERL